MMLKLEKISKVFQQGDTLVNALNEISFSLSEGEKVAIVGASGSGKTTLLSLIAGLETPSSGSIIVNGNNYESMSESQITRFRGRNIGIVFQQFHLMPHLSALENVMLPLEINNIKNERETAANFLESVGLGQRMEHLPSQLSGGECQRVAIARAFAQNPKLVLADEPTGNLDPDTGAAVMELMFNQAKNTDMTLILVTHSDELAKLCSRSIRIDGGKLR